MAPTIPLVTAYAAALRAVAAVSSAVPDYRALSEADFAELRLLDAALLQQAQARSTLVAGEIAHRSRPELGSEGLAHRLGHRTPEAMVRATTGQTARDSHTAVRVGRLAHDSAELVDAATGAPAPNPQPWLAPVGRAVTAGAVSVAGAQSIATGLGFPTSSVSSDALEQVATQLVLLAGTLDADRLYRLARDARDELDLTGVADRELERREARSLTLHRRPDGVVRLVWTMDPETAATVIDLYDRATSPRGSTPRFVETGAAGAGHARSDQPVGGHSAAEHSAGASASAFADSRSAAQFTSDAFAELLAAGAAVHADADASLSPLLRTIAPAVRVLVTAHDLHERRGTAYLEGQADAVSLETAERLACAGTTREISFDSTGQPLDVGRERRLFSHRQRIALAARDGGCRWPGCERPPSWTEAHHVQFWQRDGGETNVNDGILLCRHHHLTLHNNHWEIDRHGSDYWLVPPPAIDAAQEPVLMPSTSRAWLRMRAREHERGGVETAGATSR